jgi:hypothetical protein
MSIPKKLLKLKYSNEDIYIKVFIVFMKHAKMKAKWLLIFKKQE